MGFFDKDKNVVPMEAAVEAANAKAMTEGQQEVIIEMIHRCFQ